MFGHVYLSFFLFPSLTYQIIFIRLFFHYFLCLSVHGIFMRHFLTLCQLSEWVNCPSCCWWYALFVLPTKTYLTLRVGMDLVPVEIFTTGWVCHAGMKLKLSVDTYVIVQALICCGGKHYGLWFLARVNISIVLKSCSEVYNFQNSWTDRMVQK